MRDFSEVAKAIADGNRVRVLMALSKGDLCVCQIVELLRLAPSTVSKHLSILHQARLVESRKEGRWMYYRLPEEAESSRLVTESLTWIRSCLSEDTKIRADARLLKKIKRIHPEELCRKPCQN